MTCTDQQIATIKSHFTRRVDTLKARAERAEAEVDQLRYERRLLGAARLVLDKVAENGALGLSVNEGIRGEAADMAQRIVDEVGHPVTDEPAFGPDLRAEVERLRESEQESDLLRGRMAELLTGTANALKGTPPPTVWHDWSDLPEVAAAAVAGRDAALARLTAVEAVLADGTVTYSLNNANDPEVRAGREAVRVLTPMMTETAAIRAALNAGEHAAFREIS